MENYREEADMTAELWATAQSQRDKNEMWDEQDAKETGGMEMRARR